MGSGVPVERYYTDGGIYTSKEFTRALHDKCQGISHSVVGCIYHNGVADITIKNVGTITITMMIHDALRYPNTNEKSLCPMDMFHSVQLHKYTLHISSVMSPEVFWTSSKSYHRDIQNAHSWGRHSYVLEPRL